MNREQLTINQAWNVCSDLQEMVTNEGATTKDLDEELNKYDLTSKIKVSFILLLAESQGVAAAAQFVKNASILEEDELKNAVNEANPDLEPADENS